MYAYFFQRGRTQLVYINKQGQQCHTPVHIYLLNVLFPEKEVMNIGVKGLAILPKKDNTLLGMVKEDFWKGKTWSFYRPYSHLRLNGGNPGSFAIAQTYNEIVGTNYNAIYITKPKHYDHSKSYPFVFFCHGYLGSWELYQGILDDLENCLVVSVGTRDLSGLFKSKDMQRIFSTYIPLLQRK